MRSLGFCVPRVFSEKTEVSKMLLSFSLWLKPYEYVPKGFWWNSREWFEGSVIAASALCIAAAEVPCNKGSPESHLEEPQPSSCQGIQNLTEGKARRKVCVNTPQPNSVACCRVLVDVQIGSFWGKCSSLGVRTDWFCRLCLLSWECRAGTFRG